MAILLSTSVSCSDDMAPTPPDPPRPTTVTVVPATAQLTAVAATAQLTSEVRDQDGQLMAGVIVAWSSSDASVARVDGAGLVTAAGNGTATITATAGSASGTAMVTVSQVTIAVTVSPAADTLVGADTVRLTARATDANDHAVAGAGFEWVSSDTLVAMVDDAGLVTGVSAGEVMVTATSSGVTGGGALWVVSPEPTMVAVRPDTVVLMAIGQEVQVIAEVRDQAGNVMADATVSWSSGDTAVAVVSGDGLVTATGNGMATITATAGEVAGTAAVTVAQTAGSIVVSPAADTISLGDTLRLVAKAWDENRHPVTGAAFTWSSSDESVATVDAAGLVRGVAEGRAMIKAAEGEVVGTSEITVENPDRVALVALYEAMDGPNWRNNDGWLTDAPLKEWYGVEVDDQGRVRELLLNDLSGAIPPEIGNLTNLTVLRLVANHLTGPIPPEIGNLANLTELRLGHNLSGPIPSEIGKLTNLTVLSLSGNDHLTGPIPPEIGNLANLTELRLGNKLSGPIPPEIGNLANLTVLWLGHNLTGAIPLEIGKLTNLTILQLGSNDLTGPIPPEIGNLAKLESHAEALLQQPFWPDPVRDRQPHEPDEPAA